MFGTKVYIHNISIFHLAEVVDETNYRFMSTVAVNPNADNFFVPIPMGFIKKYGDALIDQNSESYNEFNEDENRCALIYSPADKCFIEKFEENDDFMDQM